MRNVMISMASATLLLSAVPASAFDMGPIAPLLETGVDGAWTASDEGAFYVLDNDSKSGAIKYFYMKPRAGYSGRRNVSVELDLRDETDSTRGGLIFAFQDAQNYYMFTLSAAGEITLVRKDKGKASILFRGKAKGVQDGINTLTLTEKGTAVRLSVNNLSSMTLDNESMRDGGVGIAAWGTGEFAFRNFSVERTDN